MCIVASCFQGSLCIGGGLGRAGIVIILVNHEDATWQHAAYGWCRQRRHCLPHHSRLIPLPVPAACLWLQQLPCGAACVYGMAAAQPPGVPGGWLPEWRRSGLHCYPCWQHVLLGVALCPAQLAQHCHNHCCALHQLCPACSTCPYEAGWLSGHSCPMFTFAGLRDVHIAGGVSASEMPMHRVNQSDSTRLDNTDGEIC
jgi:hypothetical protein